MAGALEPDESASGQLRERRAGVVGSDRVFATVYHEHGAANPLHERAHARLVRQPLHELGRDQRRGLGLERPADRVLALLGRMRLGKNLRDEELDELGIVLEPVVAVPLAPAVVGIPRLDECALGLGARCGSPQRQRGPDEHHAGDPVGVVRSQQQRPFRAAGQGHQHSPLGLGGVHHRKRVGGELLLAVGVAVRRAVGAAVAAAVEGEHATVPREVRDLRLPGARVDERPRRQEQDRLLALAVELPEHAHAFALDVSGALRISRARLLLDLA